VSGGTFRIKFFEPNALIPAKGCFDAVGEGSVDACWSTTGFWYGKEPALAMFTAVPFGPAAGEYLAWFYFGGGEELMDEIYAKHGLKSVQCGIIAPEASGWFRKEINTLDDLKGLKMRFYGLGAKVMEKLGVSTQLTAGGDIFRALERGSIDATEFSMPVIDLLDFGDHIAHKDVVYWFAILVAINLQTSFLTPPFGFALFYMKGVAPPEVKIQQIYRGIIPFVLLQLVGLGLVMRFPDLAMWLPNKLLE